MSAHHLTDRGEIGRAARRDVEDRRYFAEVVGAEDARGDDRQCLRVGVARVVEVVDGAAGDADRVAGADRGISMIGLMREAVSEVETAWAQQLGPKRFAQLRNLLLDLNQPT